MGRLGSPRPQQQTPSPPAPAAPPAAAAPADEKEPESNGEELYLCLVEAVKDLPMRTKMALGRALMSGQPFPSLPEDVKETCETAAELVWSDDEDEEDDEEDAEDDAEETDFNV